MNWNIFDKDRFRLLKELTEVVSIDDYYMIGGTALSLQLGLRESYDFDFCVQSEFNNEQLLKELKSIGDVEVMQMRKGTCDVLLNGVQVSFFYFPNTIINDFVLTEEIPKLKMASILDIAIMKIVAIGGRGAKKDFFDLYNAIDKCNIKMDELINGLIKKYGNNVNYVNIIMGLSYFEDAEDEILPKTFVNYNWKQIKEFFTNIQSKFQEKIENLENIY